MTKPFTNLDFISRHAALSEHVLRALLEEMVDGVVLITPTGIIREVNPAAEAIFGYGRDELLGANVSMLMPSPHREQHDGYLRHYLETGRTCIIGTGRQVFGQRSDGSLFPLDLSVSEIRADGEHLFAGIVRDVTERHRFQETLALFQRAMDGAHNGIAIARLTGDTEEITYVNEAFAGITGHAREDLLGAELSVLPFGTDDARTCDLMRRAMRQGNPQRATLHCARPDGVAYWNDITLTPIRDQEGGISHCIAVLVDATALKQSEVALRESRDQLEHRVEERTRNLTDVIGQLRREISERVRVEAALRISEQRLANAQRIARIGHWEWEIETGRLYWSDEVYRILGLRPNEMTPDYQSFLKMIPEDDRKTLEYAISRCLDEGTPYEIDHRIMCPDGSERVLHEDGELVYDDDGQPVLMRGTAQDITEQRSYEEKLRHIANFDPVTELPNRALFRDRLEHALANAHRNGRMVALLFLDLDRFKNVNDSLGHMMGDDLLRQTAARLHGCVRDGDTVARFGGDEFVVILENVEHADQASLTADRIIQAMIHPFRLGDHEHFCNVSIGISLYPDDDDDPENLVRYADNAMYLAKGQGGAGYRFYTPDMHARAMDRLVLQNSLHQALEMEQFELHYQPQLDLRSGRITGVEALVRWRHPERGLVPPSEFIPMAEDTGLIEGLGDWVLRTAAREIHSWAQRDLPTLNLSVNLSPRQFRQPDLPQRIARALADSGLPAQQLQLEITEGALIEDLGQTVATLNRLSELGASISIDDFGTGHSSLAYLKRLPVHVLKIDREFVDGIGHDPDDAAIAEAIIALSRTLRMEVVAEGVETREQATFLRERGCDLAQGYYISRPLPADAFIEWFSQRAPGRRQLNSKAP
ncbi:sensor domain-containing protein [Thioalkalivibrio denitrificans]|uniref:sensor domain-containing protein n=1 Tax=Thioalkalivibrio denitrificans TaxID=108003 RepID=UPI001FE6A6AC|nr:EAL domain-containing protein [Thioalkalivibrio denitrificans]